MNKFKNQKQYQQVINDYKNVHQSNVSLVSTNPQTAVLTPKANARTQRVGTDFQKNIGLMPGTFNPVHNAQLLIAEQVRTQLGLNKVGLMPNVLQTSFQSDTKLNISNADRLNMLRLATYTNPNLYVDTTSLGVGRSKYTYDVMKYLVHAHPNIQYYLIIGGDMVAYLPKWYKIDSLMRLVRFVGVKRAGYPVASPYPIIWVDVPYLNISSTMIRRNIRQGKSIRYFVPELVWDYIMRRHLYR